MCRVEPSQQGRIIKLRPTRKLKCWETKLLLPSLCYYPRREWEWFVFPTLFGSYCQESLMLSTSSEKKKYHLWFRTDWDRTGESLTFLLGSCGYNWQRSSSVLLEFEAHDPATPSPMSYQQVILELLQMCSSLFRQTIAISYSQLISWTRSSNAPHSSWPQQMYGFHRICKRIFALIQGQCWRRSSYLCGGPA